MPTTTNQTLPEIEVGAQLRQAIGDLARSFPSVDDAEATALAGDVVAPLLDDPAWTDFCELVDAAVRERGYIVVRGLEADGGRSLLIASRALGTPFATYGRQRIVKRFRMSPWTEGLSHTLRAGDFHTDGNVSAVPPVATAMQCEVEDPGAPEFAEQRVAFLPDLLDRLASGSDEDRDALAFLTDGEGELAREGSADVWRGPLVQDGTIRYHPQSLRVAASRRGGASERLEAAIAAIHRTAISVSVPFHTAPGDTVLVSNRTALHYRGACSVRFIRFPTEFEARSLLVLHVAGQGTDG